MQLCNTHPTFISINSNDLPYLFTPIAPPGVRVDGVVSAVQVQLTQRGGYGLITLPIF